MKTQNSIEYKLMQGFAVYEKYKWLMSSYVLDFFTENHWSRIPDSWKCMEKLTTEQIAELLDYEKHSKNFVFPLSVLSLKSVFRSNNISRKQSLTVNVSQNDKKLFWKNVKLKKRHEILIMAKLCRDMAVKCGCSYLVDVGSGLGHLSRMLTHKYGFKICAIEAQPDLITQAIFLDKQFEDMIHKNEQISIRHINMKIEHDSSSKEFLKVVQEAFNITDNNIEFGIVGLHTCGDLGPTLLRLYTELPNVKFINMAGCCYMKLTSIASTLNPGFPLSNFSKRNEFALCYHSKEIACHAIENYILKLNQGEVWRLKIHAYRATIEKILTEIDPQFKHIPLANVKYTENLEFESYCRRATSKLLGNVIEPSQMNSIEILDCLSRWRYVVIFYSLRLFFAPLIESLILYDRMLYLEENGSDVHLISGFDCNISPRMHILQGRKL